MRVVVCDVEEVYEANFRKAQDGSIHINSPSEDLLASAVCLTDLPVCDLRVPNDRSLAEHYLIAHASPDDVDPTYGENEDWIEITYSENELRNLLRKFDAN